jgi:hypothetical protein
MSIVALFSASTNLKRKIDIEWCDKVMSVYMHERGVLRVLLVEPDSTFIRLAHM